MSTEITKIDTSINDTSINDTSINDMSINDNLINVATSMGQAGKARNPSTFFYTPRKLSYDDLDNIYVGDGFGKRIVDVYANEMVRNWFKIDGDPEGLLLNYISKMRGKYHIGNAIKWARLYGTSVIIMLIDDGGELTDPVDESSIRTVESLRVIDRTQLSVLEISDWYNDPNDPKYGEVKLYTVTPLRFTKQKGSEYKIHESRILRFDGEITPPRLMIEKNSFATSVLQPMYNYLINLTQVYEYSSEIIHEFVTSVISMKNLSSTLSRPNGQEVVKARTEVMAYCKSVINGVILDADGEQYTKSSTSIAGLTDVIDKFGLALSAVSGIPYMILMGESPSGLNANSDNSIRSWYDSISAEQEESLLPQINKLISYILLSKDNPLKNKTINDVNIIFNSLWQYDEPTQIDMRNKQAQTDQIYIENSVAMPEEIAKSRFGGEQYSFETVIDTELRD